VLLLLPAMLALRGGVRLYDTQHATREFPVMNKNSIHLQINYC
jgi:hypothetical protein